MKVKAFERVMPLLLAAELETSIPKANAFALVAIKGSILKRCENVALLRSSSLLMRKLKNQWYKADIELALMQGLEPGESGMKPSTASLFRAASSPVPVLITFFILPF